MLAFDSTIPLAATAVSLAMFVGAMREQLTTVLPRGRPRKHTGLDGVCGRNCLGGYLQAPTSFAAIFEPVLSVPSERSP